MGITGWSYGGFMTMFAVTQTNRFHAAVAGAGIANWLSYYGENSIDQWMIPYFGASVYDDLPSTRKARPSTSSKVKTPTLVVVGDRTANARAAVLRVLARAARSACPNELVVYPNEGHGFTNPEHRIDVLQRALDWFDQYMP